MSERHAQLVRFAAEAVSNAEENGFPLEPDLTPHEVTMSMIEGGVFSDGVDQEDLVDEEGRPRAEYLEAVAEALRVRRGNS